MLTFFFYSRNLKFVMIVIYNYLKEIYTLNINYLSNQCISLYRSIMSTFTLVVIQFVYKKIIKVQKKSVLK